MGYSLSQKAEEDILHIYHYGVRVFGDQQAARYHDQMEATFQFLSDNPLVAHERSEISPPVRIHPFGSHIVVYVVDDAGDVFIVRVRHGHEDWSS